MHANRAGGPIDVITRHHDVIAHHHDVIIRRDALVIARIAQRFHGRWRRDDNLRRRGQRHLHEPGGSGCGGGGGTGGDEGGRCEVGVGEGYGGFLAVRGSLPLWAQPSHAKS